MKLDNQHSYTILESSDKPNVLITWILGEVETTHLLEEQKKTGPPHLWAGVSAEVFDRADPSHNL